MPKMSEYSEVSTIDESSSVLGIQGGSTKRFPLSLFYTADNPPPTEFSALTDVPPSYEGQAGKLVKVKSDELGLEFGDPPASTMLALTDTPDTYEGYAGKAAVVNVTEDGVEFKDLTIEASTVAPSSPADGKLWLDLGQGVQDQNNYIDVSNFTTDYPLMRGETAIVNYSSAASVPLNIKTVEGVYEINILGKSLSASPINNNVYLSPNNTSYSNAIKSQHTDITGTSVNTGLETRSTFSLSYAGIIQSKHSVTTITLGKSILTQGMFKYNSGSYQTHIITAYWEDMTTNWSSLGTITFPYAQSGTIIIRRIY